MKLTIQYDDCSHIYDGTPQEIAELVNLLAEEVSEAEGVSEDQQLITNEILRWNSSRNS